MNNFQQNDTFMKLAMAWEREFINILKEYNGDKIEVSFMAEVIVYNSTTTTLKETLIII